MKGWRDGWRDEVDEVDEVAEMMGRLVIYL